MAGKTTVKPPQISEKLFQQRVVQAAKMCGWLVYHTWDSRRSHPGFPDLVLVHPARKLTYFIELKTDTGKIRPEQTVWINALNEAGQIAMICRPIDWDKHLWPILQG